MEYLRESQKPNCEKLCQIMENSLFGCDFSIPGAGKTWNAMAVAKEYGLPIILFGIRGSLSHWQQVANIMGVEIIHASTYESFRSIKGCQPKHPYLRRYDYDDGSTGFVATEELRVIIDEGVLIIADEFQKIKNDNDQAKAFQAVTREIVFQGGRSRVLFLSGTPFTDPDHAINFFKTIGFITHQKLYNTYHGVFIPLGINELIGYIHELYPSEMEEVLLEYTPLSNRNVKELVFAIFTDIIVPYFTSAMSLPALDYKKDTANGYYLFDNKEQEAQYVTAVQQLEKASAFNRGTETADYADNRAMGEITKALVKLEASMLPIFERLLRRDLQDDPNCQIIVFLNYREETLEILAERLADLKPLIYDGRLTNQKQEDAVIDAFQSGRNRLMLANLRKGGVAVNLHDTHGGRRRITYMSPSYSIIDMHQASGRTYRVGLKSDATIRVVYGQVSNGDVRVLPSKILRALSRRTEHIKKILIIQAKEGVRFPGNYENYEEKAPI